MLIYNNLLLKDFFILPIRHISCIAICNGKYIYPLINIFTPNILMANSKEAQEERKVVCDVFKD